MNRTVMVAAIQMDANVAPLTERLARAETLVTQTAAVGAQLIVLPELFNLGYAYADENFHRAELLDGPTATWMRATAARLNGGFHADCQFPAGRAQAGRLSPGRAAFGGRAWRRPARPHNAGCLLWVQSRWSIIWWVGCADGARDVAVRRNLLAKFLVLYTGTGEFCLPAVIKVLASDHNPALRGRRIVIRLKR